MKIRSDYITNSSSSSFVIAYKNLPDVDEETLAKYPFLKNYKKLIERVLFTGGDNWTDEGVVSRTKEELDENFICIYGWKNGQLIEDILEEEYGLACSYNKAVEYIEKGFNILFKDVDYDDSYCSTLIHELAEDNDNFVILEDK